MGEAVLDRVRHALAQLANVTYGSRPDVAARAGELASCVTRFANSHFGTLNALISVMRMVSNETKLISRKYLNRANAHPVLFSGGALGASDPNEKGLDGRVATLLTLTGKFPSGALHVPSWGSSKTRRVVKFSFTAEIFSDSEPLEFQAPVRASRAGALGGKISLVVCADCESFIDHKKGRQATVGE